MSLYEATAQFSSSFFLSNQKTVVERHSLLMCRRLKEIIKCFYLVLNHQVISVATLSYQLSWIMFCNRYRFTLYRAQRKSEHVFHFFFHFFFHKECIDDRFENISGGIFPRYHDRYSDPFKRFT